MVESELTIELGRLSAASGSAKAERVVKEIEQLQGAHMRTLRRVRLARSQKICKAYGFVPNPIYKMEEGW